MICLESCKLCRRDCKTNRLDDKLGFCKSGSNAKLAKAYLHLWEEPPLSMGKGSGTVFFSNCNLNAYFVKIIK